MKVIRRIDNQEYVAEIDEKGVFYTGDLPKLFPNTATLAALKEYNKT